MKKLTSQEESIMRAIWQLQRCTVRDVLELLNAPDTPHSTISSVVRILEKKGYVGHKAYGKTYEYFPLISQEAYSHQSIRGIVDSYFGGSFKQMVSFFVEKNDLPKQEVQDLLEKLSQSDEKD